MKGIRRKEKAIENKEEMIAILEGSKYITIAMCQDDVPYLVTLSHGYDREKSCIYFHCAREGKKVDILTTNSAVWGQAIKDHGYAEGACDHLYATTQFKGSVSFIDDVKEKEHAPGAGQFTIGDTRYDAEGGVVKKGELPDKYRGNL